MDDDDQKKKKKLLHRDLERQRRQEMTNLYATIRNLLPLEYIKGKRAVSDHINGAVDYIKDLRQKINDMSAVRDEFKRQLDSSNFTQGSSSSSNHSSEPPRVMVNPCQGGVEIVINCAVSGTEALPLSRVLQVLCDQGLEVISSITTRVNDRFMHTIQVEVRHSMFFDIVALQQKLYEELFFIR